MCTVSRLPRHNANFRLKSKGHRALYFSGRSVLAFVIGELFLNTGPSANTVSGRVPASRGVEGESRPSPVSGWAETWSWITSGLVVLGLSSIARLLWPASENTQWLFMLIAILAWSFGCRLSGLIAKSYDFPERKYASIKRFFSGAIGLSAFIYFVFLAFTRPQMGRGNFAVLALVFLVGVLSNMGRSPKP